MRTLFLAVVMALAACDNTEHRPPVPDFPQPSGAGRSSCAAELSSTWLVCQCSSAPDSGWPASCWAQADACNPYHNAALTCDGYPRNCAYNSDGKWVCQYAPHGTYGNCVCYPWPYDPNAPPWTPPQ